MLSCVMKCFIQPSRINRKINLTTTKECQYRCLFVCSNDDISCIRANTTITKRKMKGRDKTKYPGILLLEILSNSNPGNNVCFEITVLLENQFYQDE